MSEEIKELKDELATVIELLKNTAQTNTAPPLDNDLAADVKKAKESLKQARQDPMVMAYQEEMKGDAMSGVHSGFKRRNRQNSRYGNYNAILRDYVRAHEALEEISAS